MYRTSRDKLFRLLRVASRFETRLMRRANRRQHGYLFRNYLWLFQVAPFLVALSAAVARKFFNAPEFVGLIGLTLLVLSYLATLAYPFLLAWSNRRELRTVMKSPFNLILRNASITATVDARLVPRLAQSPVEDLELLLLEIKAEKEFFERRISLIVGAIEKIGLGPGLLAAGVSLANLKSDQPEWISALAYATPLLYILGAGAHFLLMRLNRFVSVTELAISRRKSSQ